MDINAFVEMRGEVSGIEDNEHATVRTRRGIQQMNDFMKDLEELVDIFNENDREKARLKIEQMITRLEQCADLRNDSDTIEQTDKLRRFLEQVLDKLDQDFERARREVRLHFLKLRKKQLDEFGSRESMEESSRFRKEGVVGGEDFDRQKVEFREDNSDRLDFVEDELERLQRDLAELEKEFRSSQ